MKFRSLDFEDDLYPVISVGGFKYGVNTLEMSSAYSTIARNGKYIEPTNIYKIVKISSGEVVYENKFNEVQIYDEGASYLMIDSMKGVLSVGTGARYRLNYPYQAGKTGTTNNAKDVWICGCTPYYSMAVWVGNDNPKAQYGMSAQGYIFKSMMDTIHTDLEKIDFTVPECIFIENDKIQYDIEKDENVRQYRITLEQNRKENEVYQLENFIY